MDKYRVAYVDEEPSEVRKFKRYAKEEFDVFSVDLVKPLGKMIKLILEIKPHAVVVDYDLMDKMPGLGYRGTDIVNRIEIEKKAFPIFILTGFREDAENESVDVNIVYEKEHMSQNNTEFLKKIKKQIENYLQKIDMARKEFIRLKNKKSKSNLNASEENNLIELDTFLEKSGSVKFAYPAHLKESTNLKLLDQLISTNEKLLKEIKKMKR